MDYDELIKIQKLDKYFDSDSLIMQKDRHYVIRGKVIQTISDQNNLLIDIYLQKGPEFITVIIPKTMDLNIKEGEGIEAILTNLRFYPT